MLTAAESIIECPSDGLSVSAGWRNGKMTSHGGRSSRRFSGSGSENCGLPLVGAPSWPALL